VVLGWAGLGTSFLVVVSGSLDGRSVTTSLGCWVLRSLFLSPSSSMPLISGSSLRFAEICKFLGLGFTAAAPVDLGLFLVSFRFSMFVFCIVVCMLFCVTVLVYQRLWVASDVALLRWFCFINPKGSGYGSITRKGCLIINPKRYVTNVLESSLDLSSYAFKLERAFMLAAVFRVPLALGFCIVLAVDPFTEFKP